MEFEILEFTDNGIFIKAKTKKKQEVENNDVLLNTIYLGRYIVENDLINRIENIHNDNINTKESTEIKNNEKNNEIFTNKKFLKLLTKWFYSCGMPDGYEKTDKPNHYFLHYKKYMNHILKFCEHFYLLLESYEKKENISEYAKFTVTYNFEIDEDGNPCFKSSVGTLYDIVMMNLLAFAKNGSLHLKRCEYCNEYFFGIKSKKTCSNRCRDLRNGKYEKRKLREEQRTKNYDSNNRQEQV